MCKTKGKKNIKLGRAQQNELRVHDISISRNHAEINISKEGELYIRDVKSKFGTLVLVKSPELIAPNSEAVNVYQIGRSVFLFNSTLGASKSIGASICKRLSKRKSKSKSPEKKRETLYESSNDKTSKEADMILEIEVEKLQKNNDSEFYLDDEFYERLANEFNQKQNPPPLDHNDIRVDEEEAAHQTEVEEDRNNDDEEDEGYNPLAQTSDGRKNDLGRLLSRLATNVELPNRETTHMRPSELQEEEKKLSRSLSSDNLEIRIDTIAPRFRGTLEVSRSRQVRESLMKNSDEESVHNNAGCQSMREIHKRELEIMVPETEENEKPALRLRRMPSPQLQLN